MRLWAAQQLFRAQTAQSFELLSATVQLHTKSLGPTASELAPVAIMQVMSSALSVLGAGTSTGTAGTYTLPTLDSMAASGKRRRSSSGSATEHEQIPKENRHQVKTGRHAVPLQALL